MLTINNPDELRAMLELLKPYCVTRLKLGDLELNIDPAMQAIQSHEPLDDLPTEEKVRVSLQDLLAEQQADLEWST